MAAGGAQDLSAFEKDPRLFLFTSLTAGSSHIITATSRLETILKANKIPFQAIDTATDEKARRLWQRRARGKKLPGLVKDGLVIGDLEEIEEWNEFGELKENIGDVPANNAAPASGGVGGVNIRPAESSTSAPNRAKSPEFEPKPSESTGPSPLLDKSNMVALPGAAEMAERNKAKSSAASTSSPTDKPAKVETMSAATEEKQPSINFAQEKMAREHPSVDHLSAPPSATHSGTASPEPEAEPEPKFEAEPALEAEPEPAHVPAAAREHRESDVRDTSVEEIKKIEGESALREEDKEDDETKEVREGVESAELKDSEHVTKVDEPEIMHQ